MFFFYFYGYGWVKVINYLMWGNICIFCLFVDKKYFVNEGNYVRYFLFVLNIWILKII